MDEFLETIQAHRNEFYRFIYRNVWDSSVAEDVFSSAVLAAYENRKKYTPGTNFRAWMFRILLNKCFVANRETGRSNVRLDDPAKARTDSSAADFVGLEAVPEYRDLLQEPEAFFEQCGDEVYRAFRRLSTAQRGCILLRDVERFSYKEIAEIMEIPVGTVMTHLARGRKKLREELLDYARAMGIVRTFPRLRKRENESGEKDEGSGVSS